MTKQAEPWYIHAVLYLVILILIYVLIQVAIVEPTRVIEKEKYYQKESRLRMENIRAAEILWQNEKGVYIDNLDTLVHFIKTDTMVANLMTGVDTITGRSSNPFEPLSNGVFEPESLFSTPKSQSRYILKVDSSIRVDTTINRYGTITRIDTIKEIGNLYFLECPDGYGNIGDLYNEALKNTASWE